MQQPDLAALHEAILAPNYAFGASSIWRRPIKLLTMDADGDALQISAEPA